MKAISLHQPGMPTGYERRLPLDPTSPCWPWAGDRSDVGYPRLMIDGQIKYAHRLVYQLHVGPIPKHWQLDHVCHSIAVEQGLCDGGVCAHRACWNPRHLEAVSSAENSRRGNHPLFVVHRSMRCRRGHDLTDPANITVRKDGRRRCAVCDRESQRARRQR